MVVHSDGCDKWWRGRRAFQRRIEHHAHTVGDRANYNLELKRLDLFGSEWNIGNRPDGDKQQCDPARGPDWGLSVRLRLDAHGSVEP